MAATTDFVSAQKAVVLYMQTLSLLAGETRFDLSAQIDDLGEGIKAHADTGLTQSPDFPTAAQGMTFTFGAKTSTSGRLMPEHEIRQATGQAPALISPKAERFCSTTLPISAPARRPPKRAADS